VDEVDVQEDVEVDEQVFVLLVVVANLLAIRR
jgi:hypothetical protein